MDQNLPGYQSVISQLVAAVVGKGAIYYVTIASTLCVLCLSANTSFIDFPRLCRLVAEDDYLPRSFTVIGRRLVFSVGILFLALASGLLLFVFEGITDRLIPLYAVGAFTAFVLSQSGMVAHWRRAALALQGSKTSDAPQASKAAEGVDPPTTRTGAHVRAAVNATGAVTTAVALGIILIAKFSEGAWITIIVIPLLITLFKGVNRHYRRLAKQVAQSGPLAFGESEPPVVVVAIRGWDKLACKSLRLAMWISSDVIALHLTNLAGDEEATDPLVTDWPRLIEKPAEKSGSPPPKLWVVDTPYRTFVEPIMDQIGKIERQFPGRQIAVMIPTLVEKHWWQRLLHSRHADRLRTALLERDDRRTLVISVPWHIHD
jgi:hypothetical protein